MAKRTETLTPKAKKTRQAIVTATLEIVSRSGSHAVNVMMICKEAGIGRTSFYNYFDNSDELLAEVAELATSTIRDHFEKLHINQPRGLARLEACLEMIFDLAVSDPETMGLIIGIAQTHDTIPELLATEIASELKGEASKTKIGNSNEKISMDSRFLAACVLAVSQQLVTKKFAPSEKQHLVKRLLAICQV